MLKSSLNKQYFFVVSYFPLVGVGDFMLKRPKKNRSTSYQHIEPQKDISTYKIFSQEKILRN